MSIGIVDLSSMFHRLWHVDKDNVTHKIVSFLKTLQHDDIIVAIDSPPYKRKDSYPEYKANRDIPDPELIGCLKETKNKIYLAGFRIAFCDGWEADDVIGTLVLANQESGQETAQEIFVYGSDKDLLQIAALTDPFTLSTTHAFDRLGVHSVQVVEYLALLGDASDNIKGAPGIGAKTAVALLQVFGSIDNIYKAIDETPEKFTKPSILKSLQESKEAVYKAIDLITLNTNCQISYLQKEVEALDIENVEIVDGVKEEPKKSEVKQEVKETAVVLRTEPLEYRKSLEPVGMNEAWKISKVFVESGLYPKFKGPEQVIMIIMRGRELGLGATTSLELIDMIQGKPTMKAAGMLALVMQHKDVCEYIYCAEMSDDKAIFVTKRIGYPKEVSRTFTIEDAKQMGLDTKDNWKKQPAVMLQWRACSQLIRQVYPDLINGLYSTEELIDG